MTYRDVSTARRLHAPRGVVAALAAVLALGSSLLPSAAQATPAPVTGPTAGGTVVTDEVPRIAFSAVASGYATSYGFDADGVLYAWGGNPYGQLGNGDTTNSSIPVRVSPPGTAQEGFAFTSVSPANWWTFGLGTDGKWYSWGRNSVGQLGDGTTTDRAIPVPVRAPAGTSAEFAFVQLTGGQSSAFGLGNDGQLYAWGTNDLGQLGDGTKINRLAPVRVLPPLGAPAGFAYTHVTAGYDSAYALGNDGAWYAWGMNAAGQLGDDTTTNRTRAVAVLPPAGAAPGFFLESVQSAGGYAVFGMGNDGRQYAWGLNDSGQLGDGTRTARYRPTAILHPEGVDAGFAYAKLFPGNASVYALGTDGVLYAWGENYQGQLGVGGPLISRSVPTAVRLPADAPADFQYAEVSAGRAHMLAIGSNGRVYGLGQNLLGQLGNNSIVNADAPVSLFTDATVTEVTFGGVPGTELGQEAMRWHATTPSSTEAQRLCGPVDVEVRWDEHGRSHAATIPSGFTFGSAPQIVTDPESAAVVEGDSFTATAQAEGDTAPLMQWQREDESGEWQDIPDATSGTLTVSDLTATTRFRMVAQNCWGAEHQAVSAPATATVIPLHTVAFKPNGGTERAEQQTAARPTELNPATFTRTGYNFVEWNTAADGSGTAFADRASYAFDSDLTLFAQWEQAPVDPSVPTEPTTPTGPTEPTKPTAPAQQQPGAPNDHAPGAGRRSPDSDAALSLATTGSWGGTAIMLAAGAALLGGAGVMLLRRGRRRAES